MEQNKRKGFGSKLGFILAAVGSAVGLGNIWKFPYMVASNGGGAFVLVYLISVILLGSVVMVAEMFLGKRSQNNVIDAYGKVNKRLKWVGMLCLLVPFFITTYYIVIGGWSTGYAVDYLLKPDFTNTAANSDFFAFFIGNSTETMTASAVTPIFFTALFFVACIMIVAGGVEKGIEKAGKILMPLLFVILLVIVIKSLTLGNGVGNGLKFYIGKFDFVKLGWKGAVNAMGQAFYSLSLGMGIMIAYGSYTGKKTNLGKSALIISGLDTLIALLMGFAIFPAIFALVPNPETYALSAGPTLLFKVIPMVFAKMTGGAFFGFLFFSLIVFAAVTSVVSLVEVISQYATDKYKMERKKATMITGLVIGLISIFVSLSMGDVGYRIFGTNLLDYFDQVTNTILMPLLASIGCITVGWFMKTKDVYLELDELHSDFKFKKPWMFMVKFVTPALIIMVCIMGIIDKWKEFAESDINYGYMLLGAAVLIIFSIVWNLVVDSKKFQEYRAQKALANIEKE